MKCPKCKSDQINEHVAHRHPFNVNCCKLHRTVKFAPLRMFTCKSCSYKWNFKSKISVSYS
jgi:hypothetical protein